MRPEALPAAVRPSSPPRQARQAAQMPRISYPTVGCTAESPVSVTRTICAAGVNVRVTIEVKTEVQVSMPGNVPNPVSFDCNRYKVQAQRAVAGVVGAAAQSWPSISAMIRDVLSNAGRALRGVRLRTPLTPWVFMDRDRYFTNPGPT